MFAQQRPRPIKTAPTQLGVLIALGQSREKIADSLGWVCRDAARRCANRSPSENIREQGICGFSPLVKHVTREW